MSARLLNEPGRGEPSTSGARLVELAERLRVGIGLQRRLLRAGAHIDPGWCRLGWETIDRQLDELVESLPREAGWA